MLSMYTVYITQNNITHHLIQFLVLRFEGNFQFAQPTLQDSTQAFGEFEGSFSMLAQGQGFLHLPSSLCS